jgi:hypothetical protein
MSVRFLRTWGIRSSLFRGTQDRSCCLIPGRWGTGSRGLCRLRRRSCIVSIRSPRNNCNRPIRCRCIQDIFPWMPPSSQICCFFRAHHCPRLLDVTGKGAVMLPLLNAPILRADERTAWGGIPKNIGKNTHTFLQWAQKLFMVPPAGRQGKILARPLPPIGR